MCVSFFFSEFHASGRCRWRAGILCFHVTYSRVRGTASGRAASTPRSSGRALLSLLGTLPCNPTPAGTNSRESAVWTCSQGLRWVNWDLLATLLESCCKQQGDSSFLFFPSFYLKLSFLQGENENWLAVCLLNSDQFKNILVWRLQGVVRLPKKFAKDMWS